MFDQRLRVVKEAALGPLARLIGRRTGPTVLSFGGLLLSIATAIAAWRGLVVVSVVCWLSGRMLDGLDGIVARQRSSASDLGAYLDIMLDTIGYAAVPLGIAVAVNRMSVWTATAFLLASFYVNALSWTYLAALLEKRAHGANARGEMTSVTMQTGLIEGAETIVVFTAMLLFPRAAAVLFSLFAAAVGVTALQRVRWAISTLGVTEVAP
jgi:phosphatidylglycerophosphate synthase